MEGLLARGNRTLAEASNLVGYTVTGLESWGGGVLPYFLYKNAPLKEVQPVTEDSVFRSVVLLTDCGSTVQPAEPIQSDRDIYTDAPENITSSGTCGIHTGGKKRPSGILVGSRPD